MVDAYYFTYHVIFQFPLLPTYLPLHSQFHILPILYISLTGQVEI